VVEVDLARKRIALTMKVQDPGGRPTPAPANGRDRSAATQPPRPAAAPQTSLGAAFAKLKR
jgi:protein Tex